MFVYLNAISTRLAAQDSIAAGWTPTKLEKGINFSHASGNATVRITEFDGIGVEKAGQLFNQARALMPPECGDMSKTVTRTVGDSRLETSNTKQKWNCLLVVMRGTKGLISIIAMDRSASEADSKGFAYSLIATASTIDESKQNLAQSNQVWPKGGLVAATRAEIDWPTALQMGLRFKRDLLPTQFECFHMGARRPNPNADGILTIKPNGIYDYKSSEASGQGTWQREEKNDLVQYRFSGPVGHRKDDYGSAVVRSDDYGQRITLAENSGEKLHIVCHQSGPSAEHARIQMADGLLEGETIQCKFADGGVQLVQFANGRYQSPRGSGIYRSFSINKDGDKWEGGFEFDGGLFENAAANLKVNNDRQRSIYVAKTVSTRRGFWYSASETTPIAQCLSPNQGRQSPEYGAASAPFTNVASGPSGEYLVWKYDAFSGGQKAMIYSFAPNGWYLDEAPKDRPIDCRRTKPSGEPICLRYELTAGKIRLQDYPGRWDKETWETFKSNGNSLQIGDANYQKVKPLTGTKLTGTYKTQSSFSSGDIANSLATVQFNGEYVFTADGQFTTASAVFSRLGLGPGIGIGNAVTGASYANSSSVSKGRYRIEGNWLILIRDNGVEARQYIYNSVTDGSAGESMKFVYIGDSLYSRQ